MSATPPPPPVRRAPDLAPAEATTAGWFAALPREGAPAWDVPGVGRARPAGGFRRFALPLGAAAAVLFALLLPSPGGDRCIEPVGVPAYEANLTVAVVDDPSVPMLHALETFDQLAFLTQPDRTGVR
jgi:hypothetical protein